MRRALFFSACLLLGGLALSLNAATPDDLKKQFKDPPREYSIEPLWSWNGTLRREKLIWQIDQMVDKGVYGAYMHARDGLDQSKTPYFSDGFWDAVKVSVEHAEKAGFRAWIYDEDKWPSGDAGGRTRAANPERFTATGLIHESKDVTGPSSVALEYPGAVVVVAARLLPDGSIDSASLTDLSALKGNWRAPAGKWRVSAFLPYRERSGGIKLPNYLNPDAVREFLSNTYEQYAKRVGQHFGKTIPGVFFDEIYNLVVPWDPILEQRFRQAKGYALKKSLPLLFMNGGRETIKVRCDYYEVFTKLYEEAWFKQISGWTGRHNLMLTGHTNEEMRTIRDQGDYFRTWRHPQMPGTDNEDFRYTWPRTIGSWKPKQLSSVAHVYGRRRAMVEALGGAGWTVTLDQARYGVNMLAVYGINSFVFHLFHYSLDTPVAMNDWPNTWGWENPYWKYFKKFADYTRRVSFMGAQGDHVCDIAVLYPVEEVWSQGYGHPLARPVPTEALVDRLVQKHMDHDLVDTDSLLKASLEGGRVKIGTESYRALVLPDAKTVSRAAYRRVAELARAGLRVYALMNVPRHSAEAGADDPEVMKISEELFQRGARVAGTLDELTAMLGRDIPADVEIESPGSDALRVLHRRVGTRDIYFFANSEQKLVPASVKLSAKGAAERWDPETGEATPLAAGPLQLTFEPWQAFFVVVDTAGKPTPSISTPAEETVLALDGPWSIQLAPRELDDAWKPDPGTTRVEVPVADIRFDRAGSVWRRLKLSDPLNPKRGAARYLSAWDAPFITRYVYKTKYPGELGGEHLTFTYSFLVPFQPASASIETFSDGRVNCQWNGAKFNADKAPARFGSNTVTCTVDGSGYLLAQGEIRGLTGEVLPLRTSSQWTVAAEDERSQPAYEFAWPPFGKWGEPLRKSGGLTLPATVLYRINVPPGAFEMEPPTIRGEWEQLTRLPGSKEIILKATIRQPGDGLQGPVAFRCQPAAAKLGDWRELGVDWYSGRTVYRTSFDAPRATNVTLDLGELCYTGEIWLNGKLVDTVAWAPYRIAITRYLKPGRNELVVVVANLLANEMRWRLFDTSVSTPVSRWWHDGSILRDGDKLRSGLIGPVRLLVR